MDLNLNAPVCNSLFLKNNKSVLRNNFACMGYEEYNQVLCKEKLSGRCYFEVQWEGAGCSIVFSYDNSAPGFVFGSNNTSWKCDFPTSILLCSIIDSRLTFPWSQKLECFLIKQQELCPFNNVSDKWSSCTESRPHSISLSLLVFISDWKKWLISDHLWSSKVKQVI